MPAVAAIPALALIAGCAAGLLFSTPSYLVFESVLALATLVAIVAWHTSRSALFLGAVVAAFFGGGVLLAAHAWQEAWRPTLRLAFEEAERLQRSDAIASHRVVSDDVAVPMEIEGTLRTDASPSETGASLSLEVDRIYASARPRADGDSERGPPASSAVAGGVALTVIGDRARESVGDWCAGRRIHTTAQLRRPSRYLDPGVPDQEELLARRGTTLVGTVKSGALVDVVAHGSVLAEGAASVRAFVRRVVAQSLGAPAASDVNGDRAASQAAAIVTAILIGDRAGLDEDVQRSLQEAGTYHVIAISGGNIAIFAGLTLLAFRVAGVLGRAAMLSAMAGLFAYAYLVGGGASVDRATLMAAIYFAGRAIDQRSPPFNTMAVSAGVLAAADPLTVADPAFLLTFGATLAILAVMPIVASAQGIPKVLAPAVSMVAASAASEAALLPVSAAIFSRVTFAGLALNFAAIPLMAVTQVAGMALIPIALVSSRLARLAGWIAYAGARGLVWSAGLVRFAPAVTWRVAPPRWPFIAIYYLGLVAAWALWRRNPRPSLTRAALASALCVAVWILFEPWSYIASRGDGRLHVTFVDVGQGDAAFVRFPHGATLLVDTGGLPGDGAFDVGDRVVAPVLRDAGVHRLQTIALTHGDNDHIGGAPSLLREFRPADVWEGIPVPALEALQARRAVAASLGARWTNVQASDRTVVDDVTVVVRNPPPPEWERQRVRNDDSIVLELLWNDVSIVLTGDAGAEAEQFMAAQFARSPLRVIKVPHHGSLTSSTRAFLDALAPRVAVVSVGRSNPFGHPNPAVLARYRDAGAEIFRTDQDGAVMVDTDGYSVHVRTFTGREQTFATQGHHEDTKGTKGTKLSGSTELRNAQ